MIRFAFIFTFTLTMSASFAQEICNNGKDDDGDGRIDCYDNNCAASTFCNGFYLGDTAKCEATPPAFPQFTMALDFTSPNETTNHLSRVAIGDLNRDGSPEIVTMNRYSRKIFILNGSDGSIQKQASATINIGGTNVNWEPNWEVAIANIDNDNCGEIYFFGWMDPPGSSNDGYYIFAYDCGLNYIWHTAERLLGDPINYGLADFNNDGKTELYVKDVIYNAHTGVRLINSSATTGSEWRRLNGGPVAIDMDNDNDLELVMGLAIFNVNLGNGTVDNGSLTEVNKHNKYFIRNEYNATSVADYNQDGHVDILASGSLDAHGRNTTVFFWDVFNNSLKVYGDSIPGVFSVAACPAETGEFYKYGWRNGTGRLNIADLDGDGKLNVSYVSGKFLYALDENLRPLSWSPKVVNEETSGHTGCTLFDFNGDGQSEIVYRDEKFLYIINGIDGEIYNQKACVSRTNREYPIVADVDADGQTEICVTCGTDDVASFNNFCNLGYSRYSQVRVFKTGGDPWVPARRVWNQHGYFNVNINDDLTVPIIQQKHHIVFSSGRCTEGDHRPLNTFLNQTPFLNRDGCPTYKSPNLAFVENSLSVNEPTCPERDFTISFQFTNKGDIGLSGDFPITFYSGNPAQTGTVKLNTINISLTNFQVGAVQTVTNATVNGFGNEFTLYIVLNDNGSTVPTPIKLPNTNFLECDYGDNILSAPIVPGKLPVEAVRISDNIKCTAIVSPDNGSAKATVIMPGGVKNTTDFNFYWTNAAVPKPAPGDRSGSIINGLSANTYSVIAVHKTANCVSASDTVLIRNVPRTISVNIDVMNPFTNCENPDGKLKAIVNDTDDDGTGDPEGNFIFEWYEGTQIINNPKISANAIASGLKPDPTTYTVIVYEKATGCPTSETASVPSEVDEFEVDVAVTDILCSSANSGTVTATVNGSAVGYSFDWYKGSKVKPTADFTGSFKDQLAASSYTVVGKDNVSKCESEAVTISLSQTDPILVEIAAFTDQSSCDPIKPNGSASATADGTTDTNLYDFEWFNGQNTSGIAFANTPAVTGLAAGIYTVRATKKETGCSHAAEVTIESEVLTHEITPDVITNLTNCRTPNGSVTVNISPDTPGDYTFQWFEGEEVKATADFNNTDNTLENLPVGKYTVKAFHKTKHCSTNSLTFEVEDNTPAILIQQNNQVTQLPSSCNANNGQMEITVTPDNTLGYVIEWFRNSATVSFTSDSGVFTSLRSDLTSGLYTVRAKNLDNGCSATKDFPLPFADPHDLLFIDKDDAVTCVPENEGRIEVQLAPTPTVINGNAFTVADYIIRFYSGKNSQGTLISEQSGSTGTLNADNSANYTFPALTPGFYTIIAVENHAQLSNCESVPVVVEILPYTIRPVINLSSAVTHNTNCTSSLANGEITIEIKESSDAQSAAPRNPADYTFSWSPNTTTITENAVNLIGGKYSVQVMNNATQCLSETDTIQILDMPPVISVTEDVDLIVTDITKCNYPNGASATVQSVNQVPLPTPPGYSFEWLDSNQSPWPNAVTPATGSSIIDLSAGTYFVRVTRTSGTNGLGCQSSLVEFTVDDKTPGTVIFDLESFINPTQCLKPFNLSGELEVTANADYSYQWYAGSSVSTGQIMAGETNATLAGITMPAGTTELDYTVEVTNTTNACIVSSNYTLTLDVRPVTITASASPLTSCIQDDGTLFATVTSGSSFDYTYNWYNGAVVKASPDYPNGKEVTNRSEGTYTVQAIDNMDASCKSEALTVQLEIQKVYPTVSAQALAPMTMCDPSNPVGVAFAHVNSDVSNYNFSWYQGATASGSPIYQGAEAGNLNAFTYAVVASHLVSGCTDTTTVTINSETLAVPNPTIELLSDVTSCLVDNGALTAHVNGNTSNYIFHWYHADPGTPVDTTSQRFRGENYIDLAAGEYYVSATDRITGCISGPAHGPVNANPLYPDFNLIIQPASCDQENGFAALNLLTDVEIDSIVWFSNGSVIMEGPMLSEIPAGHYEVTVISQLGCETTKPVDVKTEIRPFNGISRNGDGMNEIFYIDCIGNFERNVVKIFNRAGTLVYEAEGYNNTDTFFDGQSNKGVSLMGTNLPDGTYFYIIDKRDGSQPLAGYLEIVN